MAENKDAENKGFWVEKVGEYVRIDTKQRTTYLGRIESTNFDLTKLRPSLIDMTFGKSTEGEAVLERERSTPIDTRDISAIQPITREHLEKFCEYYSKENIQKRKQEKVEKERRIVIP